MQGERLNFTFMMLECFNSHEKHRQRGAVTGRAWATNSGRSVLDGDSNADRTHRLCSLWGAQLSRPVKASHPADSPLTPLGFSQGTQHWAALWHMEGSPSVTWDRPVESGGKGRPGAGERAQCVWKLGSNFSNISHLENSKTNYGQFNSFLKKVFFLIYNVIYTHGTSSKIDVH